MNGDQLIVVFFSLISLATSAWAIWCVAKSRLRYKAAWIVASLLGFVGVGVNWTIPDDLIILFGVQIPPVFVFEVLATGMVIVKAQFPIIAVIALVKTDFGKVQPVEE